MVRFQCPSCATVQEVEDSLTGQVRQCCACEQYLRVPASPVPPAEPAARPPHRRGPETRRSVPSRPATPTPSEKADSGIRPDPPRLADAPFFVPRPTAPRQLDVRLPGVADAMAEGGEDDSGESPPVPKKRARRKKKGRKKRPAASVGGTLRYYLGGIDSFGWVLVGLVVFWLASLLLSLVSANAARFLVVLGNGLVLIGNIWIAFIAYRDSHVYGVLCFGTCLFTYVYIFMNLEETWRPAALTGLGFFFAFSGVVIPHLF
jgi:hypothetical protein